jgi:GrpB-like predicted nucleotidyltransferase (UPF0157 family)
MSDQNENTWITEIHLVEYDPQWPKKFEAEAAILHEVLGENAISIEHIGSTAVPGMDAKPVVDLMVEVLNLDKIQSMEEVFVEVGYEVLGESGIPGRHFITRNAKGTRTHDVHIFETDHNEVERMVLFRDHLRENPEAAKNYSELKHRLAIEFQKDPIRYTRGKSEFILNAVETQRRNIAAGGE